MQSNLENGHQGPAGMASPYKFPRSKCRFTVVKKNQSHVYEEQGVI